MLALFSIEYFLLSPKVQTLCPVYSLKNTPKIYKYIISADVLGPMNKLLIDRNVFYRVKILNGSSPVLISYIPFVRCLFINEIDGDVSDVFMRVFVSSLFPYR